jgi:uncharacterized protein YjbI with pentapeptide repeats
MADEEQLRILKQGAEAWNAWRWRAGAIQVDLSEADLRRANLRGADVSDADLRDANLRRADLRGANLRGANLHEADLSEANLYRADLSGATVSGTNLRGANLHEANLCRAHFHGADFTEANLRGADLRGGMLVETTLLLANLSQADLREASLSGAKLALADLREANLRSADLCEADLTGAHLNGTVLAEADFRKATLIETTFANVDLSTCKNLYSVHHQGPSTIDFRTLQRSGHLPLAFLRGIGLPDNLIEYLPSLVGQAIQHYSCFISYSSKDEEFVHRLHADLQDKGVRCWFAPHDMKIGAKIRDTIEDAIRLRDKVLLVLSEASIASDWVEDEVDKAFEEERQRGKVVLFPVRVDNAVMETKEAWAATLQRSRHIGDFRTWKDHDAYQKALERVLRDLRVESSEPA